MAKKAKLKPKEDHVAKFFELYEKLCKGEEEEDGEDEGGLCNEDLGLCPGCGCSDDEGCECGDDGEDDWDCDEN